MLRGRDATYSDETEREKDEVQTDYRPNSQNRLRPWTEIGLRNRIYLTYFNQ